MELG
jgi:hypothetical protein